MATKHGYSKTRLYRIWCGMKQRCDNPNAPSYDRYGGRGIKICDEWYDFLTFREWALAHGYDDTLTIDREDNDGDYCPENCRWLTIQENVARVKFTRSEESYKRALGKSYEKIKERKDISEHGKRVDALYELIEATKGLHISEMHDIVLYANWIKSANHAQLRKYKYDTVWGGKKR